MPTQWGLATAALLGLLAHAAGQKRRAWTHFEAALAFCRASAFRPELAWTCHDYAAALLDSGARDDKTKAVALLDEGEQIAAAIGLEPLRKRIAAFRERYRLRLERVRLVSPRVSSRSCDSSPAAKPTKRSRKRCSSALTPSRCTWRVCSRRRARRIAPQRLPTPLVTTCSNQRERELVMNDGRTNSQFC